MLKVERTRISTHILPIRNQENALAVQFCRTERNCIIQNKNHPFQLLNIHYPKQHILLILYTVIFYWAASQIHCSLNNQDKRPIPDQLTLRNVISTCFLIGSDNQLSGQCFLFFLLPLFQPQQLLPNVSAECKIYGREFHFCDSHQE